jgi:lipoprotein NlpD
LFAPAAAAGAPAAGGVAGLADGAPSGRTSTPEDVATLPVCAVPGAGAGANKTWPRGDKRPYSESAFAELQRPDSAPPPVRSGDKAVDKPADKPGDKPADTARPADDGLAWMWPAEGRVIGTFDGGRKGIDIAGKMGQPVLAAGNGTVLYASSVRGYGNLVIVKHSSNLLSAYAHNKAILVKEGQAVTKGQRIAEMGNSDTDAVKLHFEIRQQGKPVDPSKFLPPR